MSRARALRRAATSFGIFLVALGAAVPAGATAIPRAKLLTADLPDSILDALSKAGSTGADASELRGKILDVSDAEVNDSGLVRIRTDLRWFAATPPDGPAAPFFEVRRWPGDSVVAFYALQGAAKPGGPPPIAGSERVKPPAEESEEIWFGTIATPGGRRSAAWMDAPVPGGNRRLGTLVIPGDAGLGADAVPALMEEMIALARGAEVRVEAWSGAPAIPADANLDLPRLLPPPALADERKDVWQSIAAQGFSLGLPPGIRGMRLDGGLEAPRSIDRSILWMRGRFVDRNGVPVAVGDGVRAGYVSILSKPEPAWRTGERAPLGARSAKRIAAQDFTAACESTGANSATAERWSEPGFEGDWIVFRLAQPTLGIEIGLPVLSGRQSEALFWIPTSFRLEGQPAAPPPIDPAKRFGMDYRPLTKLEKAKQPWMEGVLSVPGLRIEVPARWFAIANLKSSDGFPIVFAADDRRTMGRLLRFPAGSADVAPESIAAWEAVRKPSKKSAEACYRKENGVRLYVTDRGDGLSFVPNAAPGDPKWERMVDTAVPIRSDSKEAAPTQSP